MNNNNNFQNRANSYYPEPLNFGEKGSSSENQNHEQHTFNSELFPNALNATQENRSETRENNNATPPLNGQNIGNMLNLLKNKNGGDVLSSLLSGNMLGGQKNPMMNEVLSSIMGTQKNQTKQQSNNTPVSFEEM